MKEEDVVYIEMKIANNAFVYVLTYKINMASALSTINSSLLLDQ